MQISCTVVGGVFLQAIRVMRKQRTDGHIFNTEGAGFNGNPTPRFAAYGATKRALSQLNKSLVEELKQREITNIGIHMVSPGMCTTELLMAGANTSQSKFFINCLGRLTITVDDKGLLILVSIKLLENNHQGN